MQSVLSECYEPVRQQRLVPASSLRPPNQFRDLCLISESPLVLSMGGTVVHAAVSLRPSGRQTSVECSVSYAGSVSSHTSNLPEESFLASRVRDAVLHNIRTEAHPKNTIQLQLLILQSDGGELAACIQAVNFVLIYSCFEMNGLMSSVDVLSDAFGVLRLDPDRLTSEGAVLTGCSLALSKGFGGKIAQVSLEGRAGRTQVQQLLTLASVAADERIKHVVRLFSKSSN